MGKLTLGEITTREINLVPGTLFLRNLLQMRRYNSCSTAKIENLNGFVDLEETGLVEKWGCEGTGDALYSGVKMTDLGIQPKFAGELGIFDQMLLSCCGCSRGGN